MGWTLAIDTSYFVAVGLASDDGYADSVTGNDTRSHSETLMTSIDDLLARNSLGFADLTHLVVGMGPGPFTGLRVGIATAETLAWLTQVPIRRVCSLDVLARQWRDDDAPSEFVVASDARRKELYWASYRGESRQCEPQVSPPQELPDLPVAGVVPAALRSAVREVHHLELDPCVMALHCHELPVARHEPYYLRPADAVVGGPPKSVLTSLRTKR